MTSKTEEWFVGGLFFCLALTFSCLISMEVFGNPDSHRIFWVTFLGTFTLPVFAWILQADLSIPFMFASLWSLNVANCAVHAMFSSPHITTCFFFGLGFEFGLYTVYSLTVGGQHLSIVKGDQKNVEQQKKE